MKLLSKSKDELVLALAHDELGGISNAINEVCNGVHIADFEFATRLGMDRAELAAILQSLTDYSKAPVRE